MGTETDGGVLARAVVGLVGVSVVAAGVAVAKLVADADAVFPYGAPAVLVAFAVGGLLVYAAVRPETLR